MSKTYNSRYKIQKDIESEIYEYPYDYKREGYYVDIKAGEVKNYDATHTTLNQYTDFSNKHSRHPNKKKHNHTLGREFKGVNGIWETRYRDGRRGDIYDRSDRQKGAHRAGVAVRRAMMKRNASKIIEEAIENED